MSLIDVVNNAKYGNIYYVASNEEVKISIILRRVITGLQFNIRWGKIGNNK